MVTRMIIEKLFQYDLEDHVAALYAILFAARTGMPSSRQATLSLITGLLNSHLVTILVLNEGLDHSLEVFALMSINLAPVLYFLIYIFT